MARFTHASLRFGTRTTISVALLLAVLACGAVRAQTIVTTQDGLVFEGKILVQGVDSLKMLTSDGKRVAIANLQVRSIAEKWPDPAERAAYEREAARTRPHCIDCPMLGGSILDPAGVNLIAGLRISTIGFRLTGMYYRDYYGGELDFLANLINDGTVIHDFYVGMGVSNNTDYSGSTVHGHDWWRYSVIGYNVSYIGIYGNIGLSFGRGFVSDRTAEVLLQLGFVKQLR